MFPVMPLCERQLRDVNPNDILNNGLYRKCDVYKGGGGYDKFPDISEKRLGWRLHRQFVVQLKGCPLRCPYCYVTPDGIVGDAVNKTAQELMWDFTCSGQNIFHLMGGAPALYLDKWPELLRIMSNHKVFHSDFLLVEFPYTVEQLDAVADFMALYAVSIKGVGESFEKNTATKFNAELFWGNFKLMAESRLNFYVTFTGMSSIEVEEFKGESYGRGIKESVFEDSFSINLVDYKALH